MALADRVGDNLTHGTKFYDPSKTGRATQDDSPPVACHNATCCWLHWEEYKMAPSADELIELGNTTGLIQKMVKHGKRLEGAKTSLALPVGSVIVFVKEANDAVGHSCVSLSPYTIGGYNQLGWFAKPGVDHGYSCHTISELRWTPDGRTVQRDNVNYYLYAVPEADARKVLRDHINSNVSLPSL